MNNSFEAVTKAKEQYVHERNAAYAVAIGVNREITKIRKPWHPIAADKLKNMSAEKPLRTVFC